MAENQIKVVRCIVESMCEQIDFEKIRQSVLEKVPELTDEELEEMALDEEWNGEQLKEECFRVLDEYLILQRNLEEAEEPDEE